MTSYYRVMLGGGHAAASECFAGGFIGADYGIHQDLTPDLADDMPAFNKKFIPIWLSLNPGKSKIAAGLSCGFLWTVAKGIRQGDVVLGPDGKGAYRAGEVTGDYSYAGKGPLQHRRPVRWTDRWIDRQELPDPLRKAVGALGAVANVSAYGEDIHTLIVGGPIVATDPTIEDPYIFALEKQLEDFLVENWAKTDLGKTYVLSGQQYPTGAGPIDILAESKDKKELLVVELKKGRATDAVVGQVLRYMGSVRSDVATNDQKVRGIIIAKDDDEKLRLALSMVKGVEFYRYSVAFRLSKA